MRLPTSLISQKVDYSGVVDAGLATASKEKYLSITDMTSLTPEAIMSISQLKYPDDPARSYAFAFGYVLGILHNIAIKLARWQIPQEGNK